MRRKWIPACCRTLLLAFLLFVPFAAMPGQAAAGETETEEASLAEWTVMLYLCGTDLESESGAASGNLEAVADTEPVPGVNFIVETGGAYQWHSERLGIEPDPSKLERWSYTEEGFRKVGEAELASMGESSTLQDFLTWTSQNYPARKYQLILWDHGGASISGVVFDELHGFSSLQLFDIASALEGSGIHLECFLTDTCLMATLETAEAIAPYASYFVGCEESLPGYGCNYASFLQYLYDDPECDGEMLGKRICSSTEQMYSDMNSMSDLGFLTMSLIDPSRITQVRKAFSDFITEVDQLLDDPSAFYRYCYATMDRETYAYREFADLYDLAERASGNGVSPQTAVALQDAVDDAVLYNIRGNSHVRSHGLTEFYSFNTDPYTLDHFSRVCNDPVYLAFLDRLSYRWKAPDWVYETVERKPDVRRKDYENTASVGVSEDGSSLYLEMPSSDSFILKGAIQLLQYDEDLDLWRDFGQDPFLDPEDDGQTLRLISPFDGKWPALNGIPLKMGLTDEQEDYVVFSTPMKEDGAADKIRILYRDSDGYRIIGSSQLDDHTGYPDRNTDPLAFGSQVEPLGTLTDLYAGSALQYKITDPFIYEQDMEVTKEALPEGVYEVRFVMTDLFGNISYTQTVSCEWDGDSVRYEPLQEDEAAETETEAETEAETSMEETEDALEEAA